jgi:hypothetical protein
MTYTSVYKIFREIRGTAGFSYLLNDLFLMRHLAQVLKAAASSRAAWI